MSWWEAVGLMLAPGGVIVIAVGGLIERTRRENNRDHAKNSKLLESIDRKVDHVSTRMDDHIEWHLDQGGKR